VLAIVAPWVTSGSSPASLITAAVALSAAMRHWTNAKLGRSPPGSVIVASAGNRPVASAS